jgi:hypothetical protein
MQQPSFFFPSLLCTHPGPVLATSGMTQEVLWTEVRNALKRYEFEAEFEICHIQAYRVWHSPTQGTSHPTNVGHQFTGHPTLSATFLV